MLLQDLILGDPFVYDGRIFYRGFMTYLRKDPRPHYKCLEVYKGRLCFVEYNLPCDTIVKPYEFSKKE